MADYLDGIDDPVLWNVIVQAIRSNFRSQGFVKRQQVVHSALMSLAQQPGLSWNMSNVSTISEHLERSYALHSAPPRGEASAHKRIDSVLWDLISRGLVYPRFDVPRNAYAAGDYLQGISTLIVTPLGERYFEADGAIHPAVPDFVAAIVTGAGGLDAEVRTALEDAQMCFQHRLLRASVVMLGLAFEIMAKAVFDIVVGGRQPHQAKDVLMKIEEAVQRPAFEAARREPSLRAVRIADEIRTARNQAAHDWRFDFSHAGVAEQLIILGGRNVVPFWAIRGT